MSNFNQLLNKIYNHKKTIINNITHSFQNIENNNKQTIKIY